MNALIQKPIDLPPAVLQLLLPPHHILRAQLKIILLLLNAKRMGFHFTLPQQISFLLQRQINRQRQRFSLKLLMCMIFKRNFRLSIQSSLAAHQHRNRLVLGLHHDSRRQIH